MGPLDPQKFYQSVQDGDIAPMYLIYGEESYLVRQALQRLKLAAIPEGMEDFNYQQFFAGDADMDQVRDAVEMLPMMASRRVVILREIDALKERDWPTLEPLFEKPVETTVFILTGTAIDKRKKAMKKLLDRAAWIEFKKPYDNQIPQWIHHIARTLEIEISDEAVHQLHARAGARLDEIELHLQKLKDFVSPRARIEGTDVEDVLPVSKEENIFDLVRSIGRKDRLRSIQGLHRALEQGQSHIGLVSLIARQIRLLLQVKHAQKDGIYGQRLAQAIQVPPYFLNQYLEQAKAWTEPQLEKMLAQLATLDLRLKSSSLEPERWMEDLIFSLGHEQA